jgi:hypothetical protein
MPSFLVQFFFFFCCKSMNNFLLKKIILCTTLRISLICAIFVISYLSLNSIWYFDQFHNHIPKSQCDKKGGNLNLNHSIQAIVNFHNIFMIHIHNTIIALALQYYYCLHHPKFPKPSQLLLAPLLWWLSMNPIHLLNLSSN